jgi:hypothetical protein
MKRNRRSGMSRRRFLGAAGAGAAGVAGAAMYGSGVASAGSRVHPHEYTIVTLTDDACWSADDAARRLLYDKLFKDKKYTGIRFREKPAPDGAWCCSNAYGFGHARDLFVGLRKEGYKFFLGPICSGVDVDIITPPEYPVNGTPQEKLQFYKDFAEFVYAWSDACVLTVTAGDTEDLLENLRCFAKGMLPMHHYVHHGKDQLPELGLIVQEEGVTKLGIIATDRAWLIGMASGLEEQLGPLGVDVEFADPPYPPSYNSTEIQAAIESLLNKGVDGLAFLAFDGSDAAAFYTAVESLSPADQTKFNGLSGLYGNFSFYGGFGSGKTLLDGLKFNVPDLSGNIYFNGRTAADLNDELELWGPTFDNQIHTAWADTYGEYGGYFYHMWVDSFLLMTQLMTENNANTYLVNKALQDVVFENTILGPETTWPGPGGFPTLQEGHTLPYVPHEIINGVAEPYELP